MATPAGCSTRTSSSSPTRWQQPVDLTGWRCEYASATGTSWRLGTPLTGSDRRGGQFLVGEAFGAGLDQPDLPKVDVLGTLALSARRARCGCLDAGDPRSTSSGTGGATTFEGTAPAPGTTNATSVSRNPTFVDTARNAGRLRGRRADPAELRRRHAPAGWNRRRDDRRHPGHGARIAARRHDGQDAGVVTAAYPTGGFAGYVIQTPGTGGDIDASPGASDAVFVFSSRTVDAVEIGDYVRGHRHGHRVLRADGDHRGRRGRAGDPDG